MLNPPNWLKASVLILASNIELAGNTLPERPTDTKDTHHKDPNVSAADRAEKMIERLLQKREISAEEARAFRNLADPNDRLNKVREYVTTKSNATRSRSESKRGNSASESNTRAGGANISSEEINEREIKILLHSYPNAKEEIEGLRKISDPTSQKAEAQKMHLELIELGIVRDKIAKAYEYKLITADELKELTKLGRDLSALERECDKRNISELIFKADISERNLKILLDSKSISPQRVQELRNMPISERYDELSKMTISGKR